MSALGRDGIFLFEGFRLDRTAGELFRRREDGAFEPMAIGSRALDVLGVLLERARLDGSRQRRTGMPRQFRTVNLARDAEPNRSRPSPACPGLRRTRRWQLSCRQHVMKLNAARSPPLLAN